jgi:hypothetical protein
VPTDPFAGPLAALLIGASGERQRRRLAPKQAL